MYTQDFTEFDIYEMEKVNLMTKEIPDLNVVVCIQTRENQIDIESESRAVRRKHC